MEGAINLKNYTSKIKVRGFTLVEMVVVMAIIAVMAAIGVSGLYASRDQYTLDAEIEELLSTIREAQNNAVAIKGASAGVKAWTVYMASDRYALKTFVDPTNDGYFDTDQPVVGSLGRGKYLPSGMTVTSGVGSYTTFSSPFSKASLSNASYVGDVSGCNWAVSTSPEKDYRILSDTNALCTSALLDSHTITLSYKGMSRSIVVRKNGDANIQ